MKKADDIPQDVWDAAEEIQRQIGWHATSIRIGISRAILAERNHCIRIASAAADSRDPGTCLFIAETIRKGTP